MSTSIVGSRWKQYVPFAGKGYGFRIARVLKAVATRTLVLLHLDGLYVRWRPWRPWAQVKVDANQSLQEAVLFPDRPEVNDALRELHEIVAKASQLLAPGARVLEIGSGTGLYVKDLEERFDVTGVDISPAMIEAARRECPRAQFVLGDFLAMELERKYDFIYSISVIQYFPASKLKRLFRKIHRQLNDNGIVLIQYPRALDAWDAWYPKLHYVRHPIATLEKAAAPYFEVLEHRASYTGDCCGRTPHPKDALVFGQLYLGKKK